jgi:tungstate transport system substrate-binding protein
VDVFRHSSAHLLFYVSILCSCSPSPDRVILATTTSVEDSGLLDTLATSFHAAHPQYLLAPVAAGTGMVLEIGRRKDADVIITHDPRGEIEFVAAGHGYDRAFMMQNDFIFAGPADDPARIRGMNALDALRRLAAAGQHPFVSRADDSGTHRRELSLWKQAGARPEGEWYVQAGVGMGDALLLAGQKRAYILTDRATYIKFRSRTRLGIITEGDPPLLNQYHVIVVRGASNEAGGRVFAQWVTSPAARQVITGFGLPEYGMPLFFVK